MKKLLEYRNMYYEIESNEEGSSYRIFEYTPITDTECVIACGSCTNPEFYNEEYVKVTIDGIIYCVNESEE